MGGIEGKTNGQPETRYRLVLEPTAASDLTSVYEWYEDCREGLGEEFNDYFNQCINWLLKHPLVPHIIYHSARRKKLARFPYYVFYRVSGENLNVLTVIHTSRSPKIWKQRIK